VAKTEAKLAGSGRLLIRPSGTEPLIRIMLEGKNEAELQQLAEDLAAVIQQALA
jgi:phosphoglucosamine mutase